MNKQTYLTSFLFFLLLSGFVSAEIVQSEKGVYYDDNILKEFENTSELEVIVFLKDSRESAQFMSDFQSISKINYYFENKIYMSLNLETFNLLIEDERVSMVLNKNAFSEEYGDSQVEYDVEIPGKFLFDKWVPVMIDIRDNTNIIVSKEDSVVVQEQKDKERFDILSGISDSVILTLSKEEFQFEGKLISGRGFYGNITKEGFEKLLSDERVRKVHSDVKGYVPLYESASLINGDSVWEGVGRLFEKLIEVFE